MKCVGNSIFADLVCLTVERQQARKEEGRRGTQEDVQVISCLGCLDAKSAASLACEDKNG